MVTSNLFTTGTLSRRSRREPDIAPTDTPTVNVIADPVAFARMASEWNETVERAAVPHPFLSHEWLSTWWECYGAGRRLHIIVVRSGARILAIAPLMWESARMYGVPVRRLRLLQNEQTPRTNIIVAERPMESYRAIWWALGETTERWDVLQLSEVPRAAAALMALRTAAVAHDHPSGTWPSDESPYLSLDQTWESYQASLAPRFRRNLRSRLTHLSMRGEPTLEILDDPAAIRDACADAFALEASGWKRSAGTSIGSDPATHRFYTDLAERAADRGWLRLLFLSVNGRRIATAYGARYQNRLLLMKTGYDPEFKKYSPFNLLTYLALRHAYQTGISEVDFLGTNEAWKREWTTTTRPHDWLFIFGNTARGRLVHQLKFRLKPALQRLCGR